MSVISLADLKAHLNLTTDDDDTLLVEKIEAAEAWVNAFTGAESAATMPAPVREAALRIAADLYEHREGTLVGVTATTLPFGVLDLLAPYRAWVF